MHAISLTTAIVLLGIGFSIGAATLLAFAFLSVYRHIRLPAHCRIAGYVMLAGLSATQLAHARFLIGDTALLASRGYCLVVLLQSLGFYWLFLGLLRPPAKRWRHVEWLLPALLFAFALQLPAPYLIVLSMLAGIFASAHLGYLLLQLRAQRRWFVMELRMMAMFGAMALLIAVLSFAAPWFGWRYFACVYASLITVAYGLILYLLLRFPDIVQKTEEAVATTYAVSTLIKVERETAVSEIKRLFEVEKIFTDEDVSLSRVAELTKLSPHQVSELINTQFQMSFSRLVRSYRVDAAKQMLINEPRASVLSVGMSVGFSSQSNFYAAFKDLTGVVPGKYRQSALKLTE